LFLNILLFLLVLFTGEVSIATPLCTDIDNDGYAVEGGYCGAVDCDDRNFNVHPDALEICDGVDTNCDGWTVRTDIDKDGDGVPMCASDCNDNDPTIYPGAPELCDGLDNDCNWFISFLERDNDGDGVRLCDVPTDCNDYDDSISPFADEISGDGIDNDCNGVIDDSSLPPCVDNDKDGFTDIACGGTDCDDMDPGIYPGAEELCDRKDSDCDGSIPYNEFDYDGDGFSACSGDCDDSDVLIYPTESTICSPLDSACNGTVKLMWHEPIANSDGSVLTDLAGYRLYFRPSSSSSSWLLDIGNTTCHGISSLPEGDWCFTLTAYDFSGNESVPSSELCKTTSQ